VIWMPRTPAQDEPACWSWSVPPLVTLEAEVAHRLAAGRGDEATIRMWLDEPDEMVRIRFSQFHDGRCAICGNTWQIGRLVDDHCHRTGQIRGYLCRSCNTREGRSPAPLFARYRRIHPAALFDLHEMYSGPGWEDGWSLRDGARTDETRTATSWPFHSPDEQVLALAES
jgi:hypothetical protein